MSTLSRPTAPTIRGRALPFWRELGAVVQWRETYGDLALVVAYDPNNLSPWHWQIDGGPTPRGADRFDLRSLVTSVELVLRELHAPPARKDLDPMTAPSLTEEIIHARIAELVLSPINYRTKLGPPEKFAQLCASVAAKGVLQPITVRPAPKGTGHEVVFGNRRFAAAQKAGLKTILAVVRDIPDADVLELQVIENAEREDPSPIEEAHAFGRLVKDHGRTVAQIAEHINRTPTYIAQRLKLLTLAKPVLEALDEEKITLAVALLIGRVPDVKLQQDALEAIDDGRDFNGMPMTADEVRKLLEEQYLLRLDQAPFDVTDAALVPKAGACTACPKRTGQQRELFPDVKSPDLCTDPKCHRTKLDALWKIRVKEAAKGGQSTVDGKEGHEAVSNRYSGTYVRLDHEEWVGPSSSKKTTVRKLVAKEKPPTFLARDDDTGEIAEVIRRADLNKVLGKEKAASSSGGAGDSYKDRERREKAKTQLRRKAIQLAVAAAIEKAGKLKAPAVLEIVVRAYAGEIWDETQRAILAGRGIDDKKGDVRTKLRALVRDCTAVDGDLLGLGLELALRAGAPWNGPNSVRDDATLWKDGLALVGIDFAKLEKQVADEEKARKAAKGKPRKLTGATATKRPTAGVAAMLKAAAGVDPEDLDDEEGNEPAPKKKAAKKKPANAKKKGGRK